MIVVSCPNAPWLASSLGDGLAELGLETEVHALDMGPPQTPPRVAVVDLDDPKATELLDHFLSGSLGETETAPGFAIIGVGRGTVDQRIAGAIALGVDDFVHTDDLDALLSRMSKLFLSFGHQAAAAERSWILSSGPDEPSDEFNHLTRVLAQAGFAVRRANSKRKTVEQLLGHAWDAWMVDGAQSPIRLKQELLKIRKHPRLHGMPIVVVNSSETAQQLLSAGIDGPIAAIPASSSISTLLFALREVTRPPGNTAPPRFLHSSVLRFRSIDGTTWHTGLTLDLSSSGIFVRSLLAPPLGEVIDVRIQTGPDTSDATRLVATVMRTNPFPIVAGGLVPAGFGLRIDVENCDAGQLTAYNKMLLRLRARPTLFIPATPESIETKNSGEFRLDVTDAELEEVFSLPPEQIR